MSRNIWLGIIVAAVLVAGGWWYLNQSSTPQETTTNAVAPNNSTPITPQIAITSVNTPTFSGTATGVTKVALSFTAIAPASYTGAKSHGGAVADVHDGHWTYTAASSFFEPGNYKVDIYPADASGKVASYNNPAASKTFTVSAPIFSASLVKGSGTNSNSVSGPAPLTVWFTGPTVSFGNGSIDFGDPGDTWSFIAAPGGCPAKGETGCYSDVLKIGQTYNVPGTYVAKLKNASGAVVSTISVTVQ